MPTISTYVTYGQEEIELIGDAGKKLHTARSRNDQIATDLRLYVCNAIDQINGEIATLESVLIDIAEQEANTIMPGLTHLQNAQPITLGHHLMAWVEMTVCIPLY